MMNDDLVRALATALHYSKCYDDSNPDVGFGPSLESLTEGIFRIAEVEPTQNNINQVVMAYRARWGNN